MLSRKEKEELIIKLLGEEKTHKDIMKIAHASPNLISSIRKKLEGEESHPSIQNQAYRMFYEERKKPIEVAILLHIDNAEATRYWKEYLQLNREYTLLKIRNEFEGNFSEFISLYREMKKKHYRLDEVKKALEIVRNTETELFYMAEVIGTKERCQEEVNQLEGDITKLNNDKSLAKSELDCLELAKGLLFMSINSLKQEKAYVEKQLTQLYATANYSMDNQLVPSNSVGINLLPSNMWESKSNG